MCRTRAPATSSARCTSRVPQTSWSIGSPGTRRRDETIKHALYERAGVREYWFIDPGRGLVRIDRRNSARFDAAVVLSAEADDVLTTNLMPGLHVSVRRLCRP